jgi:ribosomal protein S18 acetylase RimI-like enzyme
MKSTSEPVDYRWRGDVTDEELEQLHARAFHHPRRVWNWTEQLRTHSLGWVTARTQDHLVGFVNVAWDGALHAFLLDTAVFPEAQRLGIGKQLVRQAVQNAWAAGCAWLHVDDFEQSLQHFYVAECGFRVTQAGLLALS